MSRQDQSLVTVTVDGISLGTFEVRQGGATDSNNSQYRLGGMGPRISLGGTRLVENVTVKALLTDAMRTRSHWLRGRCGKGAAVVVDQPLDVDGHVVGDPDVYSGVLKRYEPPDSDASSEDAAQFTLEVAVSGDVG